MNNQNRSLSPSNFQRSKRESKEISTASKKMDSIIFDKALDSSRKTTIYKKGRLPHEENRSLEVGSLRGDLPPVVNKTYEKAVGLYEQMKSFLGTFENTFDSALDKQLNEFLLAYKVILFVNSSLGTYDEDPKRIKLL